jgi:S-adenosylmethionine synthetase
VEYSKYCLKKFNVILHHNVDKFAILGGLIDLKGWKEARLIKPVRALVNGRISTSFNNQKIPVADICRKAIKKQLSISLPELDVEKSLDFVFNFTSYSKNPRWFNPMSIDDLPEYKNLNANDTSSVVSYWPLTESERLTLDLEGYFYDEKQRPRFKEFGQDVKVMIVRRKKHFDITICVPFFIKYFSDSNSYWKSLVKLESELFNFVKERLGNKADFNLNVNTQNPDRFSDLKVKSGYFVAAGGALDYGEEGLVGRGNNRLGIIPSIRPYTMEAAYGKNPVYHVGKVIGLVSDTIAKEIANKFNCQSEVYIISRIGDSLLRPDNIIVNSSKKINKKEVDSLVISILDGHDWTKEIIENELLIPKTGNLY